MNEYIESLEKNADPMTEAEWRSWIEKEIEDIKAQDPDAEVVDTDAVIERLAADGYVRG
mgnify:CR=1 FL=1